MNRAYYNAPVRQFMNESPMQILGKLAERHGFDLENQQKQAWITQIDILKKELVGLDGHLFFEFSIPRMGKRVDVVLLSQGIVFVLEFKVGENNYQNHDLDQVMDYALDLKNFHTTSHHLPIVPFLVATSAQEEHNDLIPYQDSVYFPVKVNSTTLGDYLKACLLTINKTEMPAAIWEGGQYCPTPTIVEAAQALYRGHSVREITRSDADARNLSETTNAIDEVIASAENDHQKVICFVTGVPGAGKTLAGLNIANRRLKVGEDEHAVFLSGNGPLVIVLREALVRDEMARNTGVEGFKRKDSERKVNSFIQNIHLFRDNSVIDPQAPLEKVVIFDEAQRAWTKEMTADFMRRKRGIFDFRMSEPEFLISVMDRHRDWAVIICLVGGGQEINTGEAGLTEWFHAISNKFPHWRVFVSENLSDSEYLAGKSVGDILLEKQFSIDNRLHLGVSVRSYRTEKVSALVKAVLDRDLETAKSLFPQVFSQYPIYLTRNLPQARAWLRTQARGTERYGLLASSGAIRLRPAGIFVKSDIDVTHWFLDDKADVRSSYALEEVATEFDIQGLELDWTCVCWDADLRIVDGTWEYKAFKGSKWQTVMDETRKRYLLNSYRVLLTRARQGMNIFIPNGDENDITRLPVFYDGTYEYLRGIGIPSLDSD